jgi:predicted lipoprotein with Yx(FWY)xxD motif
MSNRIAAAAAAAVLSIVALAGCSAGSGAGSAASDSPRTHSSASASSDPAALRVASSSLGDVVVDGKGMTVYVFDKDAAGRPSACSGQCATLWPAVTTTSATPSVDGVTGTVGTAATADGGKQVTIGGLRLYTFAQDAAAGDVAGQGFGGVWWAVGASGSKVTATAGADDHGQDSAGHDAGDDNGGNKNDY